MSNSPVAVASPVVSTPVVSNIDSRLEVAALKAQIAALESQKLTLQAQVDAPRTLSFKVSEKGALSMYGMGRFPVTLYKEQWQTVLGSADKINSFIEANSTKLKNKGDETAEEAASRKARIDAYSAEAKAKQGSVYRSGDGQTSHKAV